MYCTQAQRARRGHRAILTSAVLQTVTLYCKVLASQSIRGVLLSAERAWHIQLRQKVGSRDALLPIMPAWLIFLSVGIVVEYVLFLCVFLRRSGPQDADQFLVFHSLQYWNASMFGIAKQWTPLMCAGLSLAGEPQVPFMSLSMALSYLLGPLAGVKLAIVIYLIAGWVGAYLYAGLWLRIRGQRVLAASLFIGNGFFFCRLGLGHFDFVPFLILPLMLWVLHRGIEWQGEASTSTRIVQIIVTALLMGASLALAVDGSPVAIIHLLFWIGLYALTLAVTARSAAPAFLFGGALAIALVLDAGYLWPMLQSQAAFPRRTPDQFTSVFSFLWFALLPLRGKVLPANGNGHELSVFIGPVLAYCLWRYREWLCAGVPIAMRRPLLVVSLVSIVLGMGSLRALHVPAWLSPFDLLRPLPGFRSIGVTGRYWGFLALPLSLLSAAALWKFSVECRNAWRLQTCLGAALILQLGFQAETLAAHWLHSPRYQPVAQSSYFTRGPETIEYVAMRGKHQQGEFLAPTRGVSNCYDMDDFTRAENTPGASLVKRVMQDGRSLRLPAVHAQFTSWSHVRLGIACPSHNDSSCMSAGSGRVQLVLRQAYHPFWNAPDCDTYASPHGNLVVDCPASRINRGAVELNFDDAMSDFAARISTTSWDLWLLVTGPLALFLFVTKVRFHRLRWHSENPAPGVVIASGPGCQSAEA
jgi:hypothetical protein